ncbi:MAG: poly-gamma-glutamate biosynthesis protein PgsC/CapC [Planctomycetota bacterium]
MNPVELMAPDLVRFAFVAGMVLSVALYEKSHLTTGSIVVPGFFGIHIFEPGVVGASLLNSFLCFYLVHRLGPRILFMSTRTKFHLLIAVSLLLQVIWFGITSLPSPIAVTGDMMAGFGCVIPGLIAHDMARNGPARTALSTLLVSSVVGAAVFGLVIVAPEMSLHRGVHTTSQISFDLLLVLTISTMASVVLKLSTPLRSGGYVTAAYFVFMGTSLTTLMCILSAALVTYGICCRLLIPRMIVFGRRKFAMMLIVGALLMWGFTLALAFTGPRLPLVDHPAYAGIVILLPGLIANDMQRSGLIRVTFGLGATTGATFIFASLYCEIRSFGRPENVLHLASLAALVSLACLLPGRGFDRLVRFQASGFKDRGVAS